MINQTNKHGPDGNQQILIHANRGAPLPGISARNKAPAGTEIGYLFNRGKPPEQLKVCPDETKGFRIPAREGGSKMIIGMVPTKVDKDSIRVGIFTTRVDLNTTGAGKLPIMVGMLATRVGMVLTGVDMASTGIGMLSKYPRATMPVGDYNNQIPNTNQTLNEKCGIQIN